MKRQLHLTSPLMKGKDVQLARRLLRKNAFKTVFLDAPILPARYDEDAAGGTRRAKFELGYPPKYINSAFGTVLEGYLTGKDELPAAYAKRRKKRLAQSVGVKAVAEAMRWRGTSEKPARSNIALPFTEWWGWHGWGAPWCAVLVSYCLSKAGFEYVAKYLKGDRWAYCPKMVNDARAKMHGLRVVQWASVEPGDIVLFDWDDDGVADHVGFVTKKLAGASFETIEGNTSPDNFSNGGKVVWYGHDPGTEPRHVSQVVEFVRAG